MRIYVDADACPVVRIVEKIASKYEVPVTLLCDTNHVLTSDYSEVIGVEWLSKQNRYFLIRDTDWDKVYTDIEKNPDSFGRYYPLFRVKLDSKGQIDMSIAFMINDAFYAYSGILAENMAGEKK